MSEAKPPHDAQHEPESQDLEPVPETQGKPIPPMVVIGFVIIALLGALVVIAVKRGGFGSNADPKELAEMQAKTDAMRSQINRERMAMGLPPSEIGGESIEQVAERLKKDADTLTVLAGGLEKLLTEAEARNRAKDSELLTSEQSRQSLASDNVRLQEEIRRGLVGAADADRLRAELIAAKARNDAMLTELDTLRKEAGSNRGGASKEELADLQRRLEEALHAKDFFEARCQELQAQYESAKSKLFASNENELLPAAIDLVRSLRKLEGLPDSEISAAYSRFGVDLGANVIRKLDFATGKSDLSAVDDQALRQLVNEVPDGDLILVVGYASETGNVDGNRTLSSDRATAAAELYSSVKRPGQLVQAVYLGQTDRFSSRIPEHNQIVEVWKIRKK
jgi:outer membrane protein OmpA-like peptidoglycan-associated protein